MFLTIQENELKEEIVEKKSKFISRIFYVTNEEDAQEKIKIIKKQHYDSKHNCFAYRIMKDNGIVERFSDDGEPNGTAGLPILNILEKNNLCNVLVVVTRYFGGILLGTGGLVRAYSDATIKAINSANIIKETLGLEIKVEIEYTQFELLKYYCKTNKINIANTNYENNIICFLEMTNEELNSFLDTSKRNFNFLNYAIIKRKNIRKNV